MSQLAAKSPLRKPPGRPKIPGLAGRRQEEILLVATRMFARGGYAATDVQGVADVLKVGKGTVYRYFPTKQALFQSAVGRAMVEMRSMIDAVVDGIADPLEQITAAMRLYLEFFHDHPEYVELLIQERAAFGDRERPMYFQNREANLGKWQERYRALIRDGRIRDVPIGRITDVLGDLAYGTMFTNHITRRTKGVADQAEDIIDVVFNGLLTPAERSARLSRRKETGT